MMCLHRHESRCKIETELSSFFYIFDLSYKTMIRCWDRETKKRGSFQIVREELCALLEKDDNYIPVFPNTDYYKLLPNNKYKSATYVHETNPTATDNAHDNKGYDENSYSANDCELD